MPLNPLAAWKPGPGPFYQLVTGIWATLGLPNPPKHLVEWHAGVSPLSTQKEVVVAVALYLGIVFGGRALMSGRPAFKLTKLFQAHNIILVIGSAAVLLGMLEEIVPLYLRHGAFWSICNTQMFTPRLVTYYMVNYYIKYVELIDTLFLVLKKKPLQFLHVFHHAATAVLCFTQLEGETSVQWVVITLNLTVHVIMYYYYYATAGGAKIWWKRYLTTLQITQFVIDLFITYFASTFLFTFRLRHGHYPLLSSALGLLSFGGGRGLGAGGAAGVAGSAGAGAGGMGAMSSMAAQAGAPYNHFGHKYAGFLPVAGDCAGSEGAALFGCGLLTSYLFLFIAFYKATYKKTAAAKGKGKAGVAEGKAQ